MKLKLAQVGDKAYAEVLDLKPVFIDDNGVETAIDVVHTMSTISRLNAEAKGHREAKEAAEARLKVFEGLDPEAARKALEITKNLDESKLLDAGKVEEIKRGAMKALEERLEQTTKAKDLEIQTWREKAEKSDSLLHAELINGSFARSRFVADKLAVPTDMVQAAFGKHFKVEANKVIAVDAAGGTIYSRSKPGEIAEFDEALERLVEAYPHREHILKGRGQSGAGAQGGGTGGGGKTMPRAAFDRLPQEERAAKMREGFTLTE